MDYQWTYEEIEKLNYAFKKYDRKKKGKVLAKDMGALMRKMGLNPDETQVLAETPAQQKLTFSEVKSIVERYLMQLDSQKEIRELFKMFDNDKNGFISAAELRHVMTTMGNKLSKEDVDEILGMVSIDSRGLVNYEDLVMLLATH